MAYDCVMPAAGASSRMGAWKPLLPWRGASLVEACVGAALGACSRVLLVGGERLAELASLFRGEPRVLVVANPAWALGMLGSLQRALPLVEGGAFFCANADMPLIEPADYETLEARYAILEASGAPAAVFAAHGGEAGHPVLVPSSYIAEILLLPPGGRMKSFLSGKPSCLVERGPGVLADLDTPDDYERAARLAP